VAGLVLAGCGGDNGAAAPAASSTTVTSTVAPITTSVATTTTSTSSTSTTTSTTAAPPTTVAPAVLAEMAVRASVDDAVAAFSECVLALPNCDVESLAATRSGELLRINSERISEWSAAGYAIRNRESFRYVIEEVEFAPDLTRATALVCIADGTVLFIPGAGPGGADVIVDDSYVSGREAWDVHLDPDGIWRPHAAPAVGPTESRDVCPVG
jgi:hypothetical protein